MLNNIEKGDKVVIKDTNGQTKTVTVLQVKAGDQPGSFIRFDYIDHAEASPMRRTAYPKELLSILQKNVVKPPQPAQAGPGTPQKAVIIDGKTYVEKLPGTQSAVPINAEANKQVHEAVRAPAKPVTSRIKKANTAAK